MAQFTGQVVKSRFAVGSKSERLGVFLVTRGRKYLLRQMGGTPYGDPEIEKLVGKKIRATGEVDDYLLLLTKWKVLKD
jgi:hypothetical protein